jgi:hypothetical protein
MILGEGQAMCHQMAKCTPLASGRWTMAEQAGAGQQQLECRVHVRGMTSLASGAAEGPFWTGARLLKEGRAETEGDAPPD